ncbi:unnamed protein product [Lepeophtheirus salmonis]|uniref:(salmon louse) hypothetical protein n=1 Tax=Lepeophtheirus salmonis TaxID=72036 RepID=A0A7R8CY01_LEPSM|nr:unnamed protein product [Lepeophtheirus salmonis]CAF2936937.1 unnamed protein product [Lepeophtheirus salmonis]
MVATSSPPVFHSLHELQLHTEFTQLSELKGIPCLHHPRRHFLNELRPSRLFPGGQLDHDPDLVREAFSVSLLEEWDDLDGVITLEKLVKSVLSFHIFKVAGPDGIPPCVLNHLPIKMLEYLRLLFVRSVRLNEIHFVW